MNLRCGLVKTTLSSIALPRGGVGSISVNQHAVNRAKVRIDRMTGQLTVANVFGDFDGTCNKVDTNSGPKFQATLDRSARPAQFMRPQPHPGQASVLVTFARGAMNLSSTRIGSGDSKMSSAPSDSANAIPTCMPNCRGGAARVLRLPETSAHSISTKTSARLRASVRSVTSRTGFFALTRR